MGGKELALKNVKKMKEDRSTAKFKVKKGAKGMPSTNIQKKQKFQQLKGSKCDDDEKAKLKVKKRTKKKQESHRSKGLDALINAGIQNWDDINKWLQNYNNYLQQRLTIQKDNYFFGDDGVREKITKNYVALIIYVIFYPLVYLP